VELLMASMARVRRACRRGNDRPADRRDRPDREFVGHWSADLVDLTRDDAGRHGSRTRHSSVTAVRERSARLPHDRYVAFVNRDAGVVAGQIDQVGRPVSTTPPIGDHVGLQAGISSVGRRGAPGAIEAINNSTFVRQRTSAALRSS